MKTEEVKETMSKIKEMQMEVGGWERAKEVAKAEVESLNRRRKEIFAEHDAHKQAALADVQRKIDEWKSTEERVGQARADLAENQAKLQAERQDFSKLRSDFNAEKNAMEEKVKQATDKLIRIQNFLKTLDSARQGL